MRSVLTAAAIFALAGCAPRTDGATAEPPVLFTGDLVAIDARPMTHLGVRLQLRGAIATGKPTAYRIETGCRLSGIADGRGGFTGGETLSPCTEVEVAAIQELSGILQGPISLQWQDGSFAELRSAHGVVRFQASS